MSMMGDRDWFKVFAPARSGLQLFEGTVFEAPASVTDLMKVTSAHLQGVIGPIRWSRQGTTLLPAVGDDVLIAYAQNGSYWVVAWFPAA